MENWSSAFLAALDVPTYGLPGIFVLAFLSATLLPLGSEAAVLGWVHLHPSAWWSTLAVATLGNTLGGMLNWLLGHWAQKMAHRPPPSSAVQQRALRWLQRFGPATCLLSWLPIIGDPLCLLAGWLGLPAGRCAFYMALGKGLRYGGLLWTLTLSGGA